METGATDAATRNGEVNRRDREGRRGCTERQWPRKKKELGETETAAKAEESPRMNTDFLTGGNKGNRERKSPDPRLRCRTAGAKFFDGAGKGLLGGEDSGKRLLTANKR